MKKKVFNLSELLFSEVASYKIHTLAQSYNDPCVLTNFSELVMLFEIANKNQFPFPVQSNAPVGLMKHPTV